MAMRMRSTLLTYSRLICLKRITAVSHVLLHNCSSGRNFKSQWADTPDGSMIVCYHPADDFPYEHTKPIIRKDPVKPDTLHSTDSILKNKLQFDHYAMEKRGPSISDLSQMFYTTKHRWYPVGIRRRSLKKPNPPRDRDYL